VSDEYEIRLTSYATVCPVCFQLSSLLKADRQVGLIRDGWMHATIAGTEIPLCEVVE
jgi:hypothetical protein